MFDKTSLQDPYKDQRVIEGQKHALELAIKGAPLAEILETLVRTIEDQASSELLGSILLLSDDGKHLHHGAAPSLPEKYNEAIHGIAIGPTVGSCGTAAFSGKTVIVQDIGTDPLWKDFKDLAQSFGLQACWSTPIKTSAGEVLGTFALYHKVPTVPTDRDQEIVNLLANTAGILIERSHEAAKRKALEQQLAEERENRVATLQRLFQQAPAAIALMKGREHVYEVANPTYLSLIGERKLVGQPVRKALPELEGQGIFELLDQVFTTQQPYLGRAVPVSVRRSPELPPEDRCFDFVYQPLIAPNGESEGIVVVAFEVTDLVHSRLEAVEAQRRAESSERMLKNFVENIPELAWSAQPDGHIDYYNHRWYAYTGTTFEEMQGWGWEKVHDAEMLPKVVDRWKYSLESGEPFEMEFPLRGADGIMRWFLTRVAPVRDESGKIVRWFGVNTNIDEIKSAQALTAEMAAQSKEYQQALIELIAEKEEAQRKLALISESGTQL